MKIFDLFVEPEFKTLDEQEYTSTIVARWEYTISRIFMLICALSWFPPAALAMMEMIAVNEAKVLTFYGFFLGAWCFGLLVMKHRPRVWKGLGIFGKGGIAKATAFGAAPGVARMLQGVAKKMRLSHGSVDRVVLTDRFVDLLDEHNKACLTEFFHEHGAVGGDSAKVFVWEQKRA